MRGRTTIVAAQTEDDAASAFLLVVGRDSYATYNLPVSGSLTIGRGESNTVRIDDPLASRAHACLHVGESMSLEDLGSVNGTRIKDQPIQRGDRVPIRIGDTVQIGASVLIVQRRMAPVEEVRPETLRDSGLPADGLTVPRGEAMQKVHALAERAAAGTINVLITGETGVGKELLAETVHRASPRRDGPYVCLNCAALSETLLESELFGHERGAFTGAVAAKPGLLETAANGSLFLDEVGELPLATQAKLLRVIETREVTRLGSVRPRRIDVRFIAATNRDLEAEVGRGAFRQDLYFRFNGITLTIPPLRTRVSEIPHLAELFARQICRDLGRPPPVLPAPILRLLESYAWPGNIRELKNVVERAVLLSNGPIIGREHLPIDKISPPTPAAATPSPRVDTQKIATPSERDRIITALNACAGNQSRAAEMLAMPRRTFVNKLDLYKIPRPKKKNDEDTEN
ncbi:MAG TPA: sigma 54-interacting transcriptional regulator [Polyangia bacterium]|jgi:DNA-binding NtrC family response regulator|nr:sigma 54-interacting transcriptional regulator [Polyangia bacterium]